MIYNPLFETNATWSYDNPLFELDVDHSLDSSSEMSIDCSVWDPSTASGFQTGLTKEISEVYMVSVYNFSFDPHVLDLFQMHSLVAHVMDNLYDNLPFAEIGSKYSQSFELLPFESHIPATPDDEIELE